MAWESVVALRSGAGGTRAAYAPESLDTRASHEAAVPRSGLYISIIRRSPLASLSACWLPFSASAADSFSLRPWSTCLACRRGDDRNLAFQIIFLTGYVTFLQAAFNGTVDLILALVLMVGGVIGARYGAVAGRKLKAAQLRLLLAVLVLASPAV